MSDSSPMPPRDAEALERQAHAWVQRLASGSARARDARALKRWCALSEAHAQAFGRAHRLWRDMAGAAALAGADDPALAALRAAPRPAAQAVRTLPRRAFLGAGIATAAVAAGVVVMHPPLGLWPAPESWQADYRTGTGEQRSLALAPDLTVEMNTRSSIALQAAQGETAGIELIGGEVAVDATRRGRPFTVSAALGRIEAVDARFEVRHTDARSVCVRCLEGQVRVTLGTESLALRAAQELVYEGRQPQPVRSIEAGERSDWREGVLRFQRTALAQVVDEINRYRPGRVMLLGSGLAGKPVSGRFHIHDLDKALAQIQRLFRLELTALPGGIVILH